MGEAFFILSLKHSTPGRLLWWGPDQCGYTEERWRAGIYTAEQIAAEPHRLDNGHTTIAIPCGALDGPITDELLNHVPIEALHRLATHRRTGDHQS